MAKLRFPSMSRRGFLRRSPLFLASLALTACRPGARAERGSGLTSTQTSVEAVANSTTQASASSATPINLPLTPTCGDASDGAAPPSITPSQTAGPFYSPNSPQRQSLIEPGIEGTRLVLTGRVLTPGCGAIANCLLDFWQTDDEGNYDNEGYRLRGHQFTDSEGRYRLETVVPGIYPGRTRHLHVRVQPANGRMLTTQLYLPREPLNPGDFLFQPELLMAVEATPTGKQAQFNFVVEAPPSQAQTTDQLQDEAADIWTALQRPQAAYFVLMRHALAPGTGDPANFRLGDCSTQRNLSAEGRDQAKRTGEAFRQRGVAVGRVMSSEWCRCVETAELMALGTVEPFAPINSFFQDYSTEATQTEAVQQFMRENSAKPGITLMVSHFVNIGALAGSGVSSGELVVMRVGKETRPEVVGAIAPF